jgi:hypothetical protein
MNKNTEYFERLHDIAKQIVDDGSADAATVAALKSATLKLASRYSDPEHALKQLYSAETELGDLLRRAVAIVTKDDDATDDGDDDDGGGLTGHPVVQMAQLLVASGHKADLTSALNYLLTTSHGAALLHRTHKGEHNTMSTNETVESILKDCGPVSFCKAIVDRGRAPCTETELVAVLSKHAAEQFSMPGDRAFAKLYEAEISVRRACAIAKAMPFVADSTPLMVGGVDAMHSAVSDTESSEAYAQLETMAARMRATSPWLSADQAFARVFENPANASVAAKAHRRPSATTSFAFPAR